jgi:hypothetical protein
MKLRFHRMLILLAAPRFAARCATAAALVGLLGCGPQPPSLCQQHAKALSIGYVGELHGNAVLRLAVDRSGGMQGQIDVVDTAKDPSQAKPAVSIAGSGSCIEGDIRLRFGASRELVGERYRIAGANVIGMLSPEIIEGAFGYWEAELVDIQTGEVRRTSGFWKEQPKSTAKPTALPATARTDSTAQVAPKRNGT